MLCVSIRASLVVGLGLILSGPRLAEAGLGCIDACGPAAPDGETCLTLGFGCNPFTNVCEACNGPAADDFCEPGGRCVNGTCVGVVCGGANDAGSPELGPPIDAGTSSTATVADGGVPDMGVPDIGMTDAGMFPPTATVADAGPVDTGVAPPDPDRNRAAGAADDKPIFDEGCGCSSAADEQARGAGPLAWLLLGGLAAQRRRASIGPTRRSAKSSV